jgi:hypothetical protein
MKSVKPTISMKLLLKSKGQGQSKVRVRRQVSSCSVIVDKVALSPFFLLVLGISSAPYPTSSTSCSFQKDKWAKTGKLPQKKLCFLNLGALVSILLPINHLQFCNRSTRTRFPCFFFSFLEQIFSWYPKHTLHCMLLLQIFPTSTSNFSSKRSLPKAIKTPEFAAKLGTNAQHSSSAAYCQQSTSITLTFSFPDSLLCFQLTFFGRTSKNCPETFQAIQFIVSLHRNNIRSASHYISVSLLFLSFVLSHFCSLSCSLTFSLFRALSLFRLQLPAHSMIVPDDRTSRALASPH